MRKETDDELSFDDLTKLPMLDPAVIPKHKEGLTALQLLEEARAQIAKPGKWMQGREIRYSAYGDDGEARVCMIGAIRWAGNHHFKPGENRPDNFAGLIGTALYPDGTEYPGNLPFDHPVRQAAALATRFLGQATAELHPNAASVKSWKRDPNDAPVPQDGICGLSGKESIRAVRQNGSPARAKQVHENTHDVLVIVGYNDYQVYGVSPVIKIYDRAIELAKAAA
jgi:hypothetical protein